MAFVHWLMAEFCMWLLMKIYSKSLQFCPFLIFYFYFLFYQVLVQIKSMCNRVFFQTNSIMKAQKSLVTFFHTWNVQLKLHQLFRTICDVCIESELCNLGLWTEAFGWSEPITAPCYLLKGSCARLCMARVHTFTMDEWIGANLF